MKLDRKEDLNVLYQFCDFQVDWKIKMAALFDSSTKVAYCTKGHDMWPFGTLVIIASITILFHIETNVGKGV